MATVCHTDEETMKQHIISSNADCWEFHERQNEKWWYQKENGLEETRRHNQRTKTKMVGTCHTNRGLQNTSPLAGYTVRVVRIRLQELGSQDDQG